jgi:PhnB protein
MAIEGSVPATGLIVPHLVVKDVEEALEFYEKAFSAVVLYRSPAPSGNGEHIHIKVWDSLVQLSTEEPSQRRELVQGALLASPETLAGSTCVFQIVVPDVDEAYRRAVDHGAVPALPPTDMFWGDRYGWVQDPAGHVWAFAQVKEVLTPQAVEERMKELSGQMRGQNR